MQTDVTSAIEPKSNFQIDGSSTPMKSKGPTPTSIDCITQTYREDRRLLRDADENRRKACCSSVIATKPHGKAAVVSGNDVDVMGFGEVTLGPHEVELRFRLIHLWEAQNPHTKTLIGEEMLLIDEQGNVIQGFIPASRVQTYLREMTSGSVYRLNKFFGSRSKVQFRVADHNVTVTFSWNTVLTPLQNSPVPFPEDRFQFHDHEEFEANCDLRGDLYDYVGHMRLINGRAMTEHLIIDEVDIAEKRHLLWDQAAIAFCQKFKSYESTPRVLLVTTVNPKRIGETLALTSMTSSRVFMDIDVQPTRDYLNWLGSNSGVANEVIADVVTKPETVTLGELFSYIKQETAKVAWFECTATIDDVLHGSPWYLTKISVYDKSEQAVFVLLGDAGRELTGKHVSELVARYFELNEDVGDDQTVPVLPAPAPQNAIEDPADERIRKASGCLESHEAKRVKSG
ncbi:hypothetical protein Bca101_033595 [Brassica carinata]